MNKRILKYFKRGIIVLLSLYVIACALLYFFQEKMLFHPETVAKSVRYSYDSNFTEEFYEVEKGIELNSLLFKADSLKGKQGKLIFFIHGNGGNLKTLGGIAPTFTDKGYDCFLYDYRGYGKSDGSITSEADLFSDAQILYDHMKRLYSEKDIIIVGYSIGTGIASWLASNNSPRKLILEAPYFSMRDIMDRQYPIFPKFLLQYPLESNIYLNETTCPIFIFHGDKDEAIPFISSQKLKKSIPTVELFRLKGLGHTGFSENEHYQTELTEILSN